MNLLKATGTIGGLTLVSRLFGFVRDMMVARLLGAGAAADSWQLAFQMPNIFRRLFAEGAFSAAFVPLFNRQLESGGQSEARHFAIEILSVFVPILLAFSAVMMLAMPVFIWLIDDFGTGGRTNDYTITLARITFPYLALISVTTLFAAILNSLSRFAAAAAAPILLNICMISAMLAALIMGDGDVHPRTIGYALAIAVALAGLLQMLWLFYWVHKAGYRLRISAPKFTNQVKELGVLILPAIFGAGIYQISRFVDLFFLGRLEEGAFVYLAMADRLNQLPLGIIGIALGTAILPALSRFIAQDDAGGAQRVQSNAIELAMLLTVPAAIGLYFAATPLVSAIFFGGRFTMEDVSATAAVIAMLVIGLPAYVLIKVLTPGFFARKDTRTPVYTAAIALTLNIALNLILIPIYGVAGLALAGAISAWVNCAMLYTVLHWRGYFHLEAALIGRLLRIALSAAAMGATIFYARHFGDGLYDGSIIERVFSIAALVLAGAIVYFALAWVTGAIDRSKIAMLRGRN